MDLPLSTIAAGAHRPRPSRLAGSAVHRVGEDFSRAKGDKGRARDHRDRLDRYGELELIAGRRGLWTHCRRPAVSEPAADERLSRASRAGVPPAAPVASRDLPPDAEPVTRPRPACVPRGESHARICGIAPPRRCVDEGTSSNSSTRTSGSSLASTTGCKRREPAPSPPALGDRRARCWFRGGVTHPLVGLRAPRVVVGHRTPAGRPPWPATARWPAPLTDPRDGRCSAGTMGLREARVPGLAPHPL
jgi:hypothetical protein